MLGNIPQKVTFIAKPPILVDDEVVHPAFVSDADNEVTLATGQRWKEGHSWKTTAGQPAREDFTMKNQPRSGYRLLDLEVRDEGGRAYKVTSPEGYYLDLREYVLLDTILNVGIAAGGLLNGEYLFAVQGSQMKLVRYGSELYQELTEATERRQSKKIGVKDRTVGGIYKNIKGETFVFGGFVDTIEIPVINRYRHEYGTPKTLKKAQLWMLLPRWKTNDFTDYQSMWDSFVDEKLSDGETSCLNLYSNVVQSKKVVEKVGQLAEMDFIQAVKDSIRQPGYKRNHFVISPEQQREYEQYDRASMSKELNMVPTGDSRRN